MKLQRTKIIVIFALLFAMLFISCQSSDVSLTDEPDSSETNISRMGKFGRYTMYEISPRKDGAYSIYGFLRVPENVKLGHLLVHVVKNGNEQPYKDTVAQVKAKAQRGFEVSDMLDAVTLFISIPETNMHDGERYMALDTVRLLESGKFGHIDQQICRLIDEALLFSEKELGIKLPQKVDMFGYSGEGTFIVRFALLHPQYLNAVCAGGTSWSPSVALATLKGEALNYPLGLGKIEKYSSDFDLEQWKSIRFFIDIGKLDDRGSYNNNLLQKMNWSRKLTFPEVYDVFCDAFTDLTENAEMVLYENLGHKYVIDDYVLFLKQNDGESFVPIETSKQAIIRHSSSAPLYPQEKR